MVKILKGLGLLLWVAIAILLVGCGGFGIDLTEQRTYAITKPPYQIIVSGDLTEKDKEAVKSLIDQLSKYPYQDYKFNENITVHVIGSETLIESVNIKGGNNVKEDK